MEAFFPTLISFSYSSPPSHVSTLPSRTPTPLRSPSTSVDLNSAELEGFLPDELGLLADIAVFHANSNRFHGSVPDSLAGLKRVVEFDVSNNRLAGGFPKAALQMPALRYLDLRFNGFDGPCRRSFSTRGLTPYLPENFGNLTASVAVLANNYLAGCIPKSIGKMRHLNELVLTNNRLDGCLPAETGMLSYLTVFDVGFNLLSGFLPESLAVPKGVCKLPKLANFTFSHNYFNEDSRECARRKGRKKLFDFASNCFSEKMQQRTAEACSPFTNRSVDCEKFKCGYASSRFAMPPPQYVNLTPPPPEAAVLPPAEEFSYASTPPPEFHVY
ncbi:hypothetical protein HPP92_002115 [Vanilla planifolia]|uniref:Uncharacterized protein n=1 Tax=Vanilla planifolia TaxID=51239 RepID=A0A835VE72_VANPL|nr:hypothetical protein HPP92_002115 [Vanilla planifolia]